MDARISDALPSPQVMVAEVKRGMSTEAWLSPAPIATDNPFLAYVEPPGDE